MLQSVLVGIAALLAAAWLPALLLGPAEEVMRDDRLLVVEQVRQETEEEMILQLLTDNKILSIPLETYLVGVVAAEMPVSFHEEALKAQAVAARTFAMHQIKNGKHEQADLCDQSSCCQAWLSSEQMGEKLGSSKDLVEENAAAAVNATKGKVLTYGGALIDAVYFSCSGGRTESAAAVWGSDIPYLQPVDSPGEETALRYKSSVLVSYEDFRKKLPDLSLSDNPSSWFGEIIKTEGGGVAKMEIGGKIYSGTELRTLFHLNSTMFELAVTEDGILFETKGFGHRVGMSQYGANAMAQAGCSYDEILAHYYPGAELE